MQHRTNQLPATIRAVQRGDTSMVRKLVLQMLADSPDAFGETLAEAQARTEADWHEYVKEAILPPDHCAFIAVDEQGGCGFVAGDGANSEAPPDTVVVGRLWVAPRQRGTGLGRRLMQAATAWAKHRGAQHIGLGVTEMNLNALRFYEHLGYIDIGLRAPLPWDPARQIILMGRTLTE